MNPSAASEEYGIIGCPLGHSFSPGHFNALFERTGRDAVYLKFPIGDIGELPALVQAHPRLQALNVTSPYKVSALGYLDALTPEAAAVGAVNVIRVFHLGDGGFRLIGHNTDSVGFRESMRAVPPACALVAGTGGASKAVSTALSQLGFRVVFASRTAREDDAYKTYEEIAQEGLGAYSLIVNATPLGMAPREASCVPLPYEELKPGQMLYDLIYNPEETLFLQKGKEKGCRIKNGMEMLYLQADASWEFFRISEEEAARICISTR